MFFSVFILFSPLVFSLLFSSSLKNFCWKNFVYRTSFKDTCQYTMDNFGKTPPPTRTNVRRIWHIPMKAVRFDRDYSSKMLTISPSRIRFVFLTAQKLPHMLQVSSFSGLNRTKHSNWICSQILGRMKKMRACRKLWIKSIVNSAKELCFILPRELSGHGQWSGICSARITQRTGINCPR